MKKILSYFLLMIMPLCMFTGCNEEQDSEKVAQLNNQAAAFYQSVDSNLDGFDADGYLRYDGGSSDNKADAINLFNSAQGINVSNYSWVVLVEKGKIKEVYVASDKNSKTIGTYPKGLDTKGKKLKKIGS